MARGRYRMTPARRAALKKAQAASARKRKGSGKSRARKVVKGVAIGGGLVAAGAGIYAYNRPEARKKRAVVNARVKIGKNTRANTYKRFGNEGFGSKKEFKKRDRAATKRDRKLARDIYESNRQPKRKRTKYDRAYDKAARNQSRGIKRVKSKRGASKVYAPGNVMVNQKAIASRRKALAR